MAGDGPVAPSSAVLSILSDPEAGGIPDPRRVEGRTAVAERYRPYGDALALDRCYDLAVHHDPAQGTVVLEYASEGKVVATGASYGNRYISVLTLRDREVVHSLAKNSGARFSDAGFRTLIKRSAEDDDLATLVGIRSDIPRSHFILLLETASSTVREHLAAESPQAGDTIDGVVAEVVGGIRTEAREASPDFAAAQAEVERQNRIRRIGEAEIYQYAREGKFEETAIALSLLCETPIDVVERALLDPGAEIVLILAKVAGLSSTTTKAILLLRAADRGMSAKDLERALSSFDRLQPDTARRVLSFFRTRVKKPAPPMVLPAVAING